MAYLKFSEESIFLDKGINIFLNRLYTGIESHFSLSDLENKVGLSGQVAKNIQGATPKPIYVIPIVTSDLKIKNYLSDTLLKKLFVDEIVNYKTFIQFKFNNVFFEFWYLDSSINLITSANIKVQSIPSIPIYIK